MVWYKYERGMIFFQYGKWKTHFSSFCGFQLWVVWYKCITGTVLYLSQPFHVVNVILIWSCDHFFFWLVSGLGGVVQVCYRDCRLFVSAMSYSECDAHLPLLVYRLSQRCVPWLPPYFPSSLHNTTPSQWSCKMTCIISAMLIYLCWCTDYRKGVCHDSLPTSHRHYVTRLTRWVTWLIHYLTWLARSDSVTKRIQCTHGVATSSRLLKIIRLFCRISSLL